jgi:hypothetical protein
MPVVIVTILAGCQKTKTCNVELTAEDMNWFPYGAEDTLIFTNQKGNQDTLSFGERNTYTDDEVYDDQTCIAQATHYIFRNDSIGQRFLAGQYLIQRTDNRNTTEGYFSFYDFRFFQFDIQSETIYSDYYSEELAVLDTLRVGDSLYEQVYHIPATDSALFAEGSQFPDIYLTKNLEIIRYDAQDSLIFELTSRN